MLLIKGDTLCEKIILSNSVGVSMKLVCTVHVQVLYIHMYEYGICYLHLLKTFSIVFRHSLA